MKRPLKAEEVRLWTLVAATVRPAAGRSLPTPPQPEPRTPNTAKSSLASKSTPEAKTAVAPAAPFISRGRPVAPAAPDPIEPLRRRRIARERDPIEARLDLHGLDQDRARAALHAFLLRSHANGLRAVLVITGKGTMGDGVLRRRTPDWLAEPEVRPLIAGFSPAERRHGGEGALYIALKRKRL